MRMNKRPRPFGRAKGESIMNNEIKTKEKVAETKPKEIDFGGNAKMKAKFEVLKRPKKLADDLKIIK